MSWQRRSWTVTMTVPGFVGGADQSAWWRVPPFKAALRSMWRIAAARRCNYDHRGLLDAEKEIFGGVSAVGQHGAKRSRVELSLDRWRPGRLGRWGERIGTVRHPEVGNGGRAVRADLYLGYGPLVYDRATQVALKGNPPIAAIQAGDYAELRVAWNLGNQEADEVERAFALLHWIGTLGSRSRNGWGSVSLAEGKQDLPPITSEEAQAVLSAVSRRWEDCLDRDFPHAIGTDGRSLLIWVTDPKNGWQDVIRELAEIKVGFRTQFRFRGNRHPRPEDRHFLAYPVTGHTVGADGWGGNGRLANQLRFKVAKNRGGQYYGIIVHVPCGLPRNMYAGQPAQWIRDTERRVWQQVHDFLDRRQGLRRL